MKLIYFILILLIPVAAMAQGVTMNWTVDGEKREAIVFSPVPTTANVKHPLVFCFHGRGGNMQGTAQQMHIQTIWKEAIVLYPQGLKGRPTKGDTQGTRTGWQIVANQTDGNVQNKDLDFFDAMLSTMKQKYTLDDDRIYATGFSNGGIFSYLLWAERSKTIAAIGECAGHLVEPEALSTPHAALAIAGTADTTNPFLNQVQSIEKARVVDNAIDDGQPCGQYCTLYPSTTQTPVKTFIHCGGHEYPPWAPAEIVKFFKTHKRI